MTKITALILLVGLTLNVSAEEGNKTLKDVFKADWLIGSWARENGSTRFCSGAAWKRPTDKDLGLVCEMIKSVSDLGLETCVTLGMLEENQAKKFQRII